MKKSITLLLVLCMVLSVFALAGCQTEDPVTKHKVTFYDGDTVLKEVEVEDGKTVESYTPTKEGGYEFVAWYSTPSKNHEFDFTKPIKEDTKVFAGFTLFEADTRDFYVVGSGTSTLLMSSNWGKNITDAHKMTKDPNKNEYTITLDLLKGDEFQFAINSSWENKRGFGYLTTLTLEDGTAAFSGQGSVYDESTKGANIKVELSGNYTITLTTHPADDYYNTSAPTYTEETKEVYNLSTYDTITWVRNGDPLVTEVTLTEFYIKGAKITGWKDMINPATKMVANGDIHTMSVYLNKDEEFLFCSQVTVGTNPPSAGSVFVKSNCLDTAAQAFIGGYAETGTNMKALESGLYTFTYNAATNVLSVEFDGSKTLEERDYYLDGTYGGGNWGDYQKNQADHLFAAGDNNTYVMSNVALAAGEELIIRSYPAGTQNPGWSGYVDLTYAYLATNDAFEANGNNIKVKTAGNYDIVIDNYSKIVTIIAHTDSADTLDIYIKGAGINDWAHNFSADYVFTMSADQKTYEYLLTVNGNIEFGMEKHPKGETTGYGDWLGLAAIGTSGDANELFNPGSGGNFKCSTPGSYRVVYDIATGKIDFYAVVEEVQGEAFVKGSAIESWGNKPASGKMTAANGKFEIVLTMAANDEIMIQYFAVGDTSQWGEAFVASHVADGAANANFDLSGHNIKCKTAGTYKITFDPATQTITIEAQ